MSNLRRSVLPFFWQTISVNFAQGTASTVNVANYLTNPQNRTITYAVVGTLPAGVTFTGSTLAYDGVGAAAALSVSFTATQGTFVAQSAATVITIVGSTNRPVTWTTAASLTGGTAPFAFSYTLTANDLDGDPINFSYTAPSVGTVTAQAQQGNNRSLVWSGTANPAVDTTYTFTVDAVDTQPLAQVVISSAVANSASSITVTWGAITGATSYLVEKSQSSSSGFNTGGAGATSATSMTINGLNPATQYFFRVTASNATQTAPVSAVATATTQTAVVGALADWNARSTGAGVIWAHRFTSATDGSNYWAQKANNPGGEVGDASTGAHFGYISTTPISGRSEGGVIGDGCLELYLPGGQGTPVSGGWARPLGPVKAAAAAGTRLAYPADVNNAGLQALGFSEAYSVVTGDPAGKLGNAAGAYITHPTYLANNQRTFTLATTPGGTTYNEIVYAGANGVFIQYRVKFKTLPNGDNRLDYADLWGKLCMFSNMSPNNANNEIVTNVMTNLGNRYLMYSDTGANVLNNPQGSSSSGAKAQPGGAYDATCVYTSGEPNAANCWTWPKDEWVTVLLQVIPGRHNPGSNYINDGVYRDTGIRVWVARAGASSYTLIWDKTDYAFNYNNGTGSTLYASGGGNSLEGTAQAFGFNSFRFETYANPNSALQVPYAKDIWVLHDQVICSTQVIPCPAPGA